MRTWPALFVLCCQTCLFAQTGNADVSYVRDIAPILASKCFACHGPDAEQREASLRLDVRRTATEPSDSGHAAIVPGDSSASELIHRVSLHSDDRARMPPASEGEPLTPQEIQILRKWIDAGAPWEEHWAFQPLDRRPPPKVSDRTWPRNDVDRFVLAALEGRSIRPVERAERMVLLRRATFDLLGLPPSLQDVKAYASDQQPDVYDRLVERLLATPSYGERWGRHWLDVARYGDSNGGDENHAYPLAHRYRDYVISAINRDLPFDKFVRQQLAGDLLGRDQDERLQRERLAATGYLAIGMKILAEQDPAKKRADIVDEQIDAFGRAFLALSLGCARCHDHKFDPIPTKDYYALAGVFHSTKIVDRELPSRALASERQDHAKRLQELRTEIKQREGEWLAALAEAGAIVREAESFDRGNVSIDQTNYGREIGIISDPGAQDNFAEYDLEIAQGGEYVLQIRYAAAAPRPGQLIINGRIVKDQAVANTTGGWYADAQRWFSEGVISLTGRNTLRIQSQPLMSHIDKLRIIARKDAHPRQQRALEALSHALTELEQQTPDPTLVMAVSDEEVQDVRVHVRGSHLELGEKVPRGFLDVLDGADETIPAGVSGRLQLAQWLTTNARASRLTSRVIVNRIWHWHFGRGLVTTPDDFGVRGEPPTHPRLLDYLAAQLIDSGWSWKALHRLIMTSSTYQLASRPVGEDGSGALETRYFAVRRPSRLQAESIRDALLVHADRLIQATGDAPMVVTSQDPSPSDMANNLLKYESSPRRSVYLPVVRSNVYEFFALFDFPNAATPVGKRNETTIPTQSLWMMNSPAMAGYSRDLASRVDLETSAAAAVKQLYLRLYCRQPTTAEVERGRLFLRRFRQSNASQSALDAWAAYCQVLFCTNEFLYLN